jgi:hypothetical protein
VINTCFHARNCQPIIFNDYRMIEVSSAGGPQCRHLGVKQTPRGHPETDAIAAMSARSNLTTASMLPDKTEMEFNLCPML